MRPGFGDQPLGKIAEMLTNDWKMVLEHIYLQKTGKTAKDFQDYHPVTLGVLLSGKIGETLEARQPGSHPAPEKTKKSVGRWGPPTIGKRKGFSTPISTGDPVADEWEREIAAGKIPNL
jgi:hypothetical protein